MQLAVKFDLEPERTAPSKFMHGGEGHRPLVTTNGHFYKQDGHREEHLAKKRVKSVGVTNGKSVSSSV